MLAPADREAVRLQEADLSNLIDIMAIIEFRIDLEGAAAALAAQRRTGQRLKQIEGALERFGQQVANGSTDVLKHDVEFHLQIARASGNRYFYDVLSQMGRGVSLRTRLRAVEIAELDQIERLRNTRRFISRSSVKTRTTRASRCACT